MNTSKFIEGFTAFADGKSIHDNPYPRGEVSYREWRSGWQSAQRDSQETVDKIFKAWGLG